MKSTTPFVLAALALLSLAPLPRAAEAPATTPAPKPRGMHYIYLVRHGFYDRDTVNTDDRVGSALNVLGHEQAKLIGERLAKLPVKLHLLVSSDYTRARQTADDMGQVMLMTPVRDSLIHECTPTSDRTDIMRTATADEIALCESHLQAAWTRYFTPTPDADTYDVPACHGNVIRWMAANALGMDLKAWLKFDIGNCSLTVISVRPDGGARLAMYSDVGHIPVEKQTWAGSGGGWKVPVTGMK